MKQKCLKKMGYFELKKFIAHDGQNCQVIVSVKSSIYPGSD